MSTVTDTYDYTEEAVVDDFEVADCASVRTAEDIARENSFREIEAGYHTLTILTVVPKEEKFYAVVMPGGAKESYRSRLVEITLCKKGDPGAKVVERLYFPPREPGEQAAYMEGVDEKKIGVNGQYGFQSRKYFHFIENAGIYDPAARKLHPQYKGDPRKLWLNVDVDATVRAGKPYESTKGANIGQMMDGRPEIVMFSFQPAGSPPPKPKAARATGGAKAAQSPLAGAIAGAPAGKPGRPSNPDGLDDV